MIDEYISHYINQCLLVFLVIVIIIYIYRIIFMNSIKQFEYIKNL